MLNVPALARVAAAVESLKEEYLYECRDGETRGLEIEAREVTLSVSYKRARFVLNEFGEIAYVSLPSGTLSPDFLTELNKLGEKLEEALSRGGLSL